MYMANQKYMFNYFVDSKLIRKPINSQKRACMVSFL